MKKVIAALEFVFFLTLIAIGVYLVTRLQAFHRG